MSRDKWTALSGSLSARDQRFTPTKNGRHGLGYTMVAGAEVGGNACPCASPFLASLEVVELLSERRGALDPLPVADVRVDRQSPGLDGHLYGHAYL